MEKIKNLSLRKTIFLYLAVSLVLSFILSAAIIAAADKIQEEVWMKYADMDAYRAAVNRQNGEYLALPARPSREVMSAADIRISETCDFLQTYTVLLASIAGSGAAVLLFYRHKLKTPLEKLETAAKKIGKEELDFHISYDRKDEMGRLCREFEAMREQLEYNNRKLWRTVEEEKVLRSAIAHDIRSPLSVMRGYHEMLLEFLENGVFNREQVMEILREEERQIRRMDRFVQKMQKLGSVEKRELIKNSFSIGELKNDIEKEIQILGREKRCLVQVEDETNVFQGDREVIMEVTENLIENALRYAKEEIRVSLSAQRGRLEIFVADDGEGFTESLEQVSRPFYSKNMKDSLKHAGLGIYLCRLYCEKHGGRLSIENKADRGAAVKAVFQEI
ncbi:MAG: ATP-binding protein [Ruminococcus sp.]|jgi:signal transduction histidine kinase